MLRLLPAVLGAVFLDRLDESIDIGVEAISFAVVSSREDRQQLRLREYGFRTVLEVQRLLSQSLVDLARNVVRNPEDPDDRHRGQHDPYHPPESFLESLPQIQLDVLQQVGP